MGNVSEADTPRPVARTMWLGFLSAPAQVFLDAGRRGSMIYTPSQLPPNHEVAAGVWVRSPGALSQKCLVGGVDHSQVLAHPSDLEQAIHLVRCPRDSEFVSALL
jgi:hypothetical protein